MPIRSAIAIAMPASCSVTGSFSSASCSTGRSMCRDWPRSPRSTPPSQMPYWTKSGLSRLYLARRWAITAGSRFSPAIAITGSPGSRFCSPKTITVTRNSVGTMIASRPSRNFSIPLSAPRHRPAAPADWRRRAAPRGPGGDRRPRRSVGRSTRALPPARRARACATPRASRPESAPRPRANPASPGADRTNSACGRCGSMGASIASCRLMP